MCPQLTEAEKARLRDITYQGIVCPSLLLRKPLSPYYVTNITDRWVPFTGVIEMTALVDRERFGGLSLVYLPCYLAQDDRVLGKLGRGDHGAMRGGAGAHVPAVSTGATSWRPRSAGPARCWRSRPWLLHGTDAGLRTSLPSVFVLNSAQIAAGTLNVNETLGVVHDRLDELKACLGLGRGLRDRAMTTHRTGQRPLRQRLAGRRTTSGPT